MRTNDDYRLFRALISAFLDGHTIRIDDEDYTYARQGGELETEEAYYTALEHGVFKLVKVSQDDVQVETRWIRWCNLDDVDTLFTKRSKEERERMLVDINMNIALNKLKRL